VLQYYQRIGRLSESERARMLRFMDGMMARRPSRPAREVDRELREIRRATAFGRATAIPEN